MYKKLITLTSALVITIVSFGQQTGLFSVEITFQGSQREMYYSVPNDYDSLISYPLVIVLHGCGQPAYQIRDDFAFLTDSINAIVVAPQGPDFNSGFFLQQQNDIMIKNAYDSTAVIYNIDNSQIYLMGFSCNGLSTLVVGTTVGSTIFKGIIPLSATVSEANMQYINFSYDSPVCICVGGLDEMAVEANSYIHDQFLENNGKVLYLETSTLGHDYYFNGYKNKTMSCIDFIDNPSTNMSNDELEITKYEVEVYPNPAQYEITIKTNSKNITDTRVRIFDVNSNCVYDGLLKSSQIEIGFLSPGLYFIQVIESNYITNGKFIKM